MRAVNTEWIYELAAITTGALLAIEAVKRLLDRRGRR